MQMKLDEVDVGNWTAILLMVTVIAVDLLCGTELNRPAVVAFLVVWIWASRKELRL